ncbi:hypothetical protein DCAR_0625861 [Daucus carota subsp. sativus]|uniref:FAD-binding PCMH-type domain-containing protein n=2 Tax=Daucus carota subsp. sativus TaxID=79200 RepID=A0AAF0XG86_DAUCS|nr:PREDICTED: cannabidiolic acid synthase-like [Daucus carota subsp. sativus]WOH06434.1 hypothetical protein DCAR_0625861 [Daucus carota subsp. sativus]
MGIANTPFLTFLSLIFLISIFSSQASADSTQFLKCMKSKCLDSVSISKVIYTPINSSYTPIYEYSMRNPRFNQTTRLKPQVIVQPVSESQVQTVVYCAKKYGMRLRIRSGGHDFEGLSYSSTYDIPFVLLDMINLRAISVDPVAKTATVQAGATLGELYYWIYRASDTLAFPAGVWSTVGATGLICGGGYGPLRRMYGLAADNVIDARIIDVKGRILDRKAMGEDLFWAIRGGSCSSFGVILSWKLNLVVVPKTVLSFTLFRTLEQNATDIIYAMQSVAPKFPNELEMRMRISTIQSNTSARADGKTVEFAIGGLYLGTGGVEAALKIVQSTLPELGMVKEDFVELTWIQAIMISSFFNLFDDNYKPEDLLDRTFLADIPTKAKSDFVREPISKKGLNGFWNKMLEVGVGETTVIFTFYGGKMDEYSESALPFPNRAGTLYMVYTRVLWVGNTTEKLEWIRSLYSYLAPYVSKNPRRAYSNYNDLDLGVNDPTGSIGYLDARKWGKQYYNHNFKTLVMVKTRVDPENFFRQEQSIPTLSLWSDM